MILFQNVLRKLFGFNIVTGFQKIQTLRRAIRTKCLETYLGPCRAFMMEIFVEIVNNFYLLTVFAEKLHHRCLTGSEIRHWYGGLNPFASYRTDLLFHAVGRSTNEIVSKDEVIK